MTQRALNSSQANYTEFSYLEEETWGQTPTTGTPQAFRLTSDSMKLNKDVLISDEIDPDTNVPDTVDSKISTSGGFSFEFGITKYNDFLRSAFRSDFVDVSATGVTVHFRDPGVPFNADNAAALQEDETNRAVRIDDDTVYNGVVVGQSIRIAEATNADNNGVFRIIRKTFGLDSNSMNANILVLDRDLVANPDEDTVDIEAVSLLNGASRTSFTIQKRDINLDINDALTGMEVNTSSFTFQPNAKIVGEFDFMGKDEQTTVPADENTPATSVWGSRTVTAAVTEPLLTGSDDIRGAIVVEGVPQEAVMELTIATNNNLRELPTIGQKVIADLGDGRFELTGTLNLYLTPESTVKAKFRGHIPFSLSFAVGDGANRLHFYLPKCYFTDYESFAEGISTNRMENTSFRAVRDDALGGTVLISRTTTV